MNPDQAKRGASAAAPSSPEQPPVRKPDLDNPYRVTKKANVVCALEWLRGEPAMFLMAYPTVTGSGYIIQLSRFKDLVSDAGLALPRLTATARGAALRLGLDDTGPTISLITDVILANVPDLRAMPKEPPKPH